MKARFEVNVAMRRGKGVIGGMMLFFGLFFGWWLSGCGWKRRVYSII